MRADTNDSEEIDPNEQGRYLNKININMYVMKHTSLKNPSQLLKDHIVNKQVIIAVNLTMLCL